MAIEWYFKKDGHEHGPINSEEVRRLARLGMLRSTDLVRKADMTRWAPASAIKGLFPPPRAEHSARPINTAALAEQLVSAMQPVAVPAPLPVPISEIPAKSPTRGIWFLTVTAVLVAIAGGSYHFFFEPRLSPAKVLVNANGPSHSGTLPASQTEPIDPQVQAVSTDSIFDRGLALQRFRADQLSTRAGPQAHQIICDTLDNREYASIWPAALRALGEVGSPADLPRLKGLIESGPVQTQCAAMATALMLDPTTGLLYFEPRVGDDKYGSATTTCLADFGARCEPAALAMLGSKQKMCRYHALYLLKEFGSADSVQAISRAKQTESDRSIVQGYQFTIDAIHARNP